MISASGGHHCSIILQAVLSYMKSKLKMGWKFTKTEIKNSPSVIYGMEEDEELLNRQEAAMFIDKMGFGMGLSNLCAMTAIVFMHRFYICHPFVIFPWNSLCCAAILLATKMEEESRPVEYITGIANYYLLYSGFESQKQQKMLFVEDVKQSEEMLLSTLGFGLDALDTNSPPRLVVMLCAEHDLPRRVCQVSYLVSVCTMFCTTMVLQHHAKLLAYFCVYQATKWTGWQMKKRDDTHEWYDSIDDDITQDILDEMILDFQSQYKKCSKMLKKKFIIITRYINDDIAKSIMAKSRASVFYPEFATRAVITDYDLMFPPLMQACSSRARAKQGGNTRIALGCTTNVMNSKCKKAEKALSKDITDKGKENQAVPCGKKNKRSGKK